MCCHQIIQLLSLLKRGLKTHLWRRKSDSDDISRYVGPGNVGIFLHLFNYSHLITSAWCHRSQDNYATYFDSISPRSLRCCQSNPEILTGISINCCREGHGRGCCVKIRGREGHRIHYFLYSALLMIMKGFTIECKCFITRIHAVTANWWFDLLLSSLALKYLRLRESRKSLDVSVPCPRDIPDQTQTKSFINHGLAWPGPGSFIRPPVTRLMTCSALGLYWRLTDDQPQ